MTDNPIAESLNRLTTRPIVIASHPRSGTHATIDLFRKQFEECRSWKHWGEGAHHLYLTIEALFIPDVRGPISEHMAVNILGRVPRPLIKTHLMLNELNGGPITRHGELGKHWLKWIKDRCCVCYAYRDGRDVMCSYHLYRKGFDAQAHCSLGQFLRQNNGGVSHVKAWANHVRHWIALPNVQLVRYEDIIADTSATIRRLAKQFKLTARFEEPLLPQRYRNTWHRRTAQRMQRQPESTSILGQHIKGTRLEKWRKTWTHDDRAFFDQEAGDLLIELGYENSTKWVKNPNSA